MEALWHENESLREKASNFIENKHAKGNKHNATGTMADEADNKNVYDELHNLLKKMRRWQKI